MQALPVAARRHFDLDFGSALLEGEYPSAIVGQANQQEVIAEKFVDRTEEIGIEGRLKENFFTDPIPSGKATRPLIEDARIAEKKRKKGRVIELPNMPSP